MTKEMNWAQEQRIKFIKVFLNRNKRINRSDIEKKFRVSDRQAQMDLAKIRKDHPKAVKYDQFDMCYKLIGKL